jgi:hypothetical protein
MQFVRRPVMHSIEEDKRVTQDYDAFIDAALRRPP